MSSELNETGNPKLAWTGQFIGQLAEKIGAMTTVKRVYGDPIERGNVTVIPVAKILCGFGGHDVHEV